MASKFTEPLNQSWQHPGCLYRAIWMAELFFRAPRSLRLAYCVCGILVFFLFYGITQEKIMTKLYGEWRVARHCFLLFGSPNLCVQFSNCFCVGGTERFRDTAFLILINRVVSCVLALAILVINRERIRPIAPIHSYSLISICNTISSMCQYEALKYVTFPTQTLGKCAKMIPVLLLQWGRGHSVKRAIENSDINCR